MDDTLVTTELIIEWLTKQVEQKIPIDPSTWLDSCQKLNVLLQGEQETLFDLEQEVAVARNILLESDMPYNKAKSKLEESEVYKKARKQKAKIERVLSMISIAKLQSRMASEIMRGQ